MVKKKPEATEAMLTMRVPTDLLKRAEALASKLDPDTRATLGRVTRSSVLRLALVEGLRALERRYK